MRLISWTRSLLCVAVLTAALGACGDRGNDSAGAASGPTKVRLGYFPNLTHATAIVGVEKGIFKEALGSDRLEVKTFNAGPAAVEALFSDALDATYIGPNPAINAYITSKGEAIRIISGATSGGAFLVVRPEVAGASDLRGKKVASPQLGGTQDVALRHWLRQQGFKTTPQGGGDLSIVPQENAQTLETFKAGGISGAWVPEPWATRLVQEGGGKVLVDEQSLWPEGLFVTTHLVVRAEFLRKHPDSVRRLLEGQVKANRFLREQPAEAQELTNAGIGRITGKRLKPEVVTAAWKHLTFTNDPVASSLTTSANHAKEVGLLDEVDLAGIYDLGPLNEVLRAAGEKEVVDR